VKGTVGKTRRNKLLWPFLKVSVSTLSVQLALAVVGGWWIWSGAGFFRGVVVCFDL
jgi:hypothetical protein